VNAVLQTASSVLRLITVSTAAHSTSSEMATASHWSAKKVRVAVKVTLPINEDGRK